MSKLKFCVLIIITTILFSCNQNKNKTSSKVYSEPNQKLVSLNLQTANFDHIEIVRLLIQPKNMDCWATALTILYSWKYNNNTIKIEDVVNQYGDLYLTLFKTNAGIFADDEQALYKAAGLTVIQAANPDISAWYDLLKSHGPLSITVAIKSATNPNRRFIHALVINGIKGDGTPGNTFIDFVDPGDGQQHNLQFSEFIKLYEGASKWPLQIIYW